MEIMNIILEQYKHLQTCFNTTPKIEKLLEFLANKLPHW